MLHDGREHTLSRVNKSVSVAVISNTAPFGISSFLDTINEGKLPINTGNVVSIKIPTGPSTVYNNGLITSVL